MPGDAGQPRLIGSFMGHRINRVENLFCDVVYRFKTTEQLRVAMSEKVEQIKARIADREIRTQKIRAEYAIDAEQLAVLLMRFQQEGSGSVSYENQGRNPVPAGVIANLVREREMIDNEQAQIDKLELVQRNLIEEVQFAVHGTGEIKTRPAVHELDDEELAYLGF